MTAGSAQAGHLERPDLLQVEDTFSDTGQPPGVTGGAYLEMEGDDIEASVFIAAFNGTTVVGFLGEIRDFDKGSKSAVADALKNSKFVYVSAFTYVNSTTNSYVGTATSIAIESCKMAHKAVDTTGDLDPDLGAWKMGCNKQVLNDLGMGAAAQARFIAVFKGLDVKRVKPRSLTYKGKGPAGGGE